MSGARSNIVPMPMPNMAPAQFQGTWPLPSSFPAGCCPPGGMDALMQCYCDIQAAKNFIGKIVLDLMQTDPAFAQAMVQAIADSGAALPLTGVTNGTEAQPGQVGEVEILALNVSFPATASSQAVTLGVLQPGDWNVWGAFSPGVITTGVNFLLNPVPVGFTSNLVQELVGSAMAQATVLVSAPAQALISVPSLINFTLTTNSAGSGTAGAGNMMLFARRMR